MIPLDGLMNFEFKGPPRMATEDKSIWIKRLRQLGDLGYLYSLPPTIQMHMPTTTYTCRRTWIERGEASRLSRLTTIRKVLQNKDFMCVFELA